MESFLAYFTLSQFLCSLARFDLANRGMRQPISIMSTKFAKTLVSKHNYDVKL